MNFFLPSVVSNAPSPLMAVVFCLSAILFPAAPKGEQAGEPITIDQITKELINSWWDSPKTHTNARTQCEEVEHVVEIYPTVGEKAFLAVCHVNRSHVEGFTTSLIVRPRYKEAREFINVSDGGYSIDQPKVVDIEHDGISELVIGTGKMNMGIYQGELLVVRVQGWQPRVLFEERIVDCSGNSSFAYIRYDNCSFGSPASAALEFEDLDGDGLLDLIETWTYYEGFEEVSMEEAEMLSDCWKRTTDYKNCWQKENPETSIWDWELINLKVGKTVNRYLFKNGAFVPFQGQ